MAEKRVNGFVLDREHGLWDGRVAMKVTIENRWADAACRDNFMASLCFLGCGQLSRQWCDKLVIAVGYVELPHSQQVAAGEAGTEIEW